MGDVGEHHPTATVAADTHAASAPPPPPPPSAGDAATAAASAAPPPPPSCVLAFAHPCQNAACRDLACRLCARAAKRRCGRVFAPKFSASDAVGVRGVCGAAVRVDVLCARGRGPVAPPPGTSVRLFLVDALLCDLAMRNCLVVKDACALARAPVAAADASAAALGAVRLALDGARTGYAASTPLQLVNHLETVGLFAPSPPPPPAGTRLMAAPPTVEAMLDAARVVPAPPPPSKKRPASAMQGGGGGGATTTSTWAALASSKRAAGPVLPATLPFYQGSLSHPAAQLNTARFTTASEQVTPAHAGIDVEASMAAAAALYPGATWPGPGTVRLVATLVHADTGARCAAAVPAVSEDFIVRSKRALLNKAPIASTGDCVSVLPGIGIGAVTRLDSLANAATEAEIELPLPPEHARVHTVADLRRLIDHVDTSPDLDDAVRSVLGLSRSLWSGVKRAAQAAVEPDVRLRAYYLPQRTHGLLFTCTDGVPDFAAPAGVLTGVVVPTRKLKPGQRALPSPVNADESIVGYGYWRVDQVAAEGYNALKQDAHADWYTADHANWTVVTGADGDRTFTTVDALVDYMRAHCVGKEPTIEVPAELEA